MMKGNGKDNPALKQSMSEPLFAQMHQARTEFMRDHGKFFGLPRFPFGKGMLKVLVKPNLSAVAIIASTPHPRRDRLRSNPPKLKVTAKARRGFHAAQAGRALAFT